MCRKCRRLDSEVLSEAKQGTQQVSGVYAPVRDFVPVNLWEYCPDKFLDSAVVPSHDADAVLRAQNPGVYSTTFIIPPCERKRDYRSPNSVANMLHDNVPVSIFVAMMEAGIVHVLEGQPLDSFMEKVQEEFAEK